MFRKVFRMKICSKIWNKTDKGLLAAFLIPTLLMLVLFVIQGIYPFGSRSFLYMDMYHQYMPFFSEFVEKIKAGEVLGIAGTQGEKMDNPYLHFELWHKGTAIDPTQYISF